MSGVCLLRVAVFTAVMIWRVMHSSAKLRKRGLTVRAEVADRLVETDEPFLDQILGVAADQEVRGRLQPHEGRITPDEPVVGIRAALTGESEEIGVIKVNLSLRLCGSNSCHERRDLSRPSLA